MTRSHEPQNLTTTYAWDAVGNLTNKRVRDLQYQYQYNDANQLVQADHWRLRHSGAGNSRGGGPAYNHNGVLSVWDEHHLDQQHLFEHLWDPSVNHTQERQTHNYQYNQNGQLAQVDRGDGTTETYRHDALGRMTQKITEHDARYDYTWDARDRRVSTQLSDWERSYQYSSLYDGRQEHSQWDAQGNPYRSLNYLPGEPSGNGGPGSLPENANYGTLISQTVHQWENDEFRVTGFAQNYADKAYFHQDHLGSTVKITGEDPGNAFRWDYTPQGEAYGFTHRYSHEQMTRTHVGHSPKRHLVPYLYTGQYETNLTGLIHMDARWYSPQQGRWLQPDYYSFSQLALPNSARHQLLGSTSLNTQHLLRDPGQQMRYGYVAGNPLRWVDPMGLCGFWSGVGSAISGTASAVGSAIGSAASAVGSTAGSMASSIGSASATAGSIALDVAGKAWASPMTAIGLAHGGAGYIVGNIGYAMGRVEDRPEISLGHNAVQFHNNPLMAHPKSAVTLGNVISYGGGVNPEDMGAYNDMNVNWGLHEEAHTYQYQVLGPLFLPTYFMVGGASLDNPLEEAAQVYGAGEGHWWPWSEYD